MPARHSSLIASNTREVFERFFSEELIGYIEGPVTHGGRERHTLVFANGEGIGISEGGSHWVVRAKDIERKVTSIREELRINEERLKSTLHLLEHLDALLNDEPIEGDGY